MAKPDIFDDIISYIEEYSENNRYADISGTNTEDLFKDYAIPQSPPLPQAARGGTDKREMSRTDRHETGSPAATLPAPQQNNADTTKMDWKELRQAVSGCVKCPLHSTRTNTVFGDGNMEAELMFIGEGPGRDEDLQGLPFVGRAGQLLTKMISAMQFRRSDVYIANIVKCRPPMNRNPEPEEAECCMPYLTRQIELVRPKVLVLLGAVPLKYLFNKSGITRIHGQWHEYMGVKTMPTLHPAYLLRNPNAKRDAWDDLKKVMSELGKTPSSPRSRKT